MVSRTPNNLELAQNLLGGQVAAFCCIGSIPARACSCVDSSKSEAESIKSSFKWATAVFVATPVEVTIQQHELKFGNRTIPYQNYHVRLAVKEVFKGIATRYAVSDTGGPSDCSYGKMEIGHDYLIYATMSGDSNVGATAHTCFRLKTGSETGSGLPGN
jgi:hypothetical protein